MADKTRVLIADDHYVVADGVKTVLSEEAEFEVVGSATDGHEALSLIELLKPEIVILDISMPNMDGVEAARQIRTLHEKVKILVYTMSASKGHIAALFREGVSGYVLKEEPLSELVQALKAIRNGAVFYSQTVNDILQEHVKELELGIAGKDVAAVQDGVAQLSAREKEVFVLLADGLSVKEVAERLYISTKTVESHKYNIKKKLNVQTLAEFTKIAARRHLIDI